MSRFREALSLWGELLMLGIALLGPFLAITTQPWEITLALGLLGLLWVLRPPSQGVPGWMLILAAGWLGLAAAAFLPAAFFSEPAWRQGFVGEFPGVLPGTRSPQPWMTWEDWGLMAAGLGWAWQCFGRRASAEHRYVLLQLFVGGMSLSAIAALGRYSINHDPTVLASGAVALGQFFNRNQTGDGLMMAGIASFALALVSASMRRPGRVILWFALCFVFLAALIANGSRAGLGLFFLGIVVWLVWTRSGRGGKDPVWVWMGVAGVVMGVGAVLLWGGPVLARFLPGHGGGGMDSRLDTYRDAWGLVLQSPWNGVGLGNFEGVFNTVRVATAGRETRSLHPESDWFWVACELGWPGVLVLAALLGGVVWAWKPLRDESGRSALFTGCWVAGGMFVLHSFVDVSGHRIGTVWPAIYLLGLGMEGRRKVKMFYFSANSLRGIGVGLLVLAGLRWQGGSAEPWVPGRGSVRAVREAALGSGSLREQIGLFGKALAWAPLDWSLYYQRGAAEIRIPELQADGEADFGRALYLERNSPALPQAVGAAWLAMADNDHAVPAWGEVLRRIPAGAEREHAYFELFTQPNLDDESRFALRTLAGDDPDLGAIAVTAQGEGHFGEALDELLKRSPELAGVDPKWLAPLLRRWVEVGDAAGFLARWPQEPGWEVAGWKAAAVGWARSGDDEKAVGIALGHLPAPTLPELGGEAPGDVERLKTLAAISPQDVLAGMRLYVAERDGGLTADALQTLREIAPLPDAPAALRQLLARGLAAAGDFKGAWDALDLN